MFDRHVKLDRCYLDVDSDVRTGGGAERERERGGGKGARISSRAKSARSAIGSWRDAEEPINPAGYANAGSIASHQTRRNASPFRLLREKCGGM